MLEHLSSCEAHEAFWSVERPFVGHPSVRCLVVRDGKLSNDIPFYSDLGSVLMASVN